MAASNLRTVRTATILSGASLSAAVKVGGDQIIAIQLPAAWTAANLTFQGSNDDSTYQNVYDDSGNELAVTAAAGRNVTLAVGLALGAFSSLKVRSGTSGSPVAQGADRAISLVTTSGRAATSIAPGGGAAVSMSDGANVTQGAIGDAAVTGDNAGTLSAKLRGLLKQLVVQFPAALGQTTKAASLPVTLASDQGSIAANAYAQTDLIYSGTTALTPAKAFANVAAGSTDAVLVALTASKKTRVLACSVSVGGTATNLTFNSKGGGAGTAISSLKAYAANGGMVLPFNQLGWFETNAGEALTVTTGAGSTIGIDVVTVAV